MRIVAVSGGFDPVHIGHVRYLKESRALGDRLVVILNNDNWLTNKKGFVFMPEQERKEILEALEGVDEVIITDHAIGDEDRSVSRALRLIRPHIFANGGDRGPDGVPVPEELVCTELGIEMVYNVGRGGKVQSSSALAEHIKSLGHG
jgi:D-beta-D-heptose 7-phosphate kinase/D-beta-D-heptose 1-phosphate adenosyltransferase